MSDPIIERETENPNVVKPKRRTKVRKHLVTTAYKNDIAGKLDTLHVAGHTVISITPSADIRGFEIISYNEE